MDKEHLHGSKMIQQEESISTKRADERRAENLEYGLPSAWSVKDRTIPLFRRDSRLLLPQPDVSRLALPARHARAWWSGCGHHRCATRCRNHVSLWHPIRSPGDANHLVDSITDTTSSSAST